MLLGDSPVYTGGNGCGNSTESTGIPCDSIADAARLSIDKKMDDIENTIVSLEAEKLSLRLERNRYSPVSKLPNELLTNIFDLVISRPPLEVPDVVNTWKRSKQLAYEEAEYLLDICWEDLRQILHVCHSWRSVAFDYPRLWSRIIWTRRGSMVSATREMLENAKLSPLSLRFSSLGAGFEQPYLSLVLSKALDLPRVKELHVKLDSYDLGVVFRGISGPNASRLQSLYVHNTANSHSGIFGIPKEFLAMPMPRLLRLNLAHCSLDWDILNAAIHLGPSQLLELKLVDISRPTREQFYHLLSATPLLEYLHVDDTLPSPPEDVLSLDPELVGKLHLDDLMDCTIISSLRSCVDFHLRVAYSTTSAYVSFFLSCQGESRRPQHEEATLVATLLGLCGMCLQTALRPHPSLILHGPRVEPEEDSHPASGMALQDYPLVDDVTSSPEKTDYFVPSLYIRFTGPRQGGYWLLLAVLMLSVPGLKQVWVLNLPYPLDEQHWLSFFQRHTEIEHLRIDFDPTAPPSRLFTALSTPVAGFIPTIPATDTYWRLFGPEDQSLSSKSATFKLCLPALTKLSVRKQSRSGPYSGGGSPNVVQELFECLSQRRNHDLPVVELELRNFNALENDCAMLRQVVLTCNFDED